MSQNGDETSTSSLKQLCRCKLGYKKSHVFWPKIGSRIQEGCVSTHPFSKGRAWNPHPQSRKMCAVFGSCESKESLFATICELAHPGPRCFFWNFLRVWEKSRSTRRGRRKPLVSLDLNITFRQTRGSESDPWALIGWHFYKHANQFDWFE